MSTWYLAFWIQFKFETKFGFPTLITGKMQKEDNIQNRLPKRPDLQAYFHKWGHESSWQIEVGNIGHQTRVILVYM